MCPSIPTYNAQRNIQARTAAPFRQEASQPFEDQQKVLGVMQGIAQDMSHANDVMQANEARSKYGVRATEIQMRAQADPDYKNSDKYIKELEKAKTESLMGINNQEVANQIRSELDYDRAVTGLKINHNFQSKQREANKYDLQQNVQREYNTIATTNHPNEKIQASANIDKYINESLSSGVITQEDADKIRRGSEINSIQNLMYLDPQKAVDQINEANLSPEEKGKLTEEAKSIQKKNEEYADWQLQQIQKQATIDLSDALYNNNLTPQMVRDMQQKGIIDSDTAAIFDSIALNKADFPEPPSTAQPNYFIRLLEDSMGDKKQIQRTMADAAKAYSEHKMGTSQYAYFIQSSKETFERQSKGIFTPSKEQKGVGSAIDGIKSFFDNLGKSGKESEENLYEGVNKFFDRFKPGQDPDVIKKQIINEKVLEEKPDVSAFPSEGKIMIDGNGNKALVFPDGRIEEDK